MARKGAYQLLVVDMPICDQSASAAASLADPVWLGALPDQCVKPPCGICKAVLGLKMGVSQKRGFLRALGF